ncbi:MAG: hypothetical protein QXO47_06840 [Thermoproteota archaeon]
MFAKGTLGFGILVTLLSIAVFNLAAIFLRLYLLVSIMPILAGFVIGFYKKGSSVARGKAGFKGGFRHHAHIATHIRTTYHNSFFREW